MSVMGAKFQNMESKLGAQYTWTTECVDRDGAQEEWGIANCLRGMGITSNNTADPDNRERFLPFQMHCHLHGLIREEGPSGWYWLGKPDWVRDGRECCADDIIAVHSYKAEDYTAIVSWFEYEHFERAYQRIRKELWATQKDLLQATQRALPA